MSPLQIARLMGLKKATVQQIVDEHSWKVKRKLEKELKSAKKTDAQLERERLIRSVRKYAKEGMPISEIAEKLDRTPRHIRNLGSQYNIRFQRPKPAKTAKHRSLFFYNDLKQLEAKGLTKNQMAIELKISEQVVHDCFDFFEKGDGS